MAPVGFNYNSLRSQEARLTVGISSFWRTALRLFGGVAMGSGLILVLVGVPAGWLVVAVATVMIAIYQWWRWRLYRLDPIEDSSSIDNLLSSSVLGRLSQAPTPKEIATVAAMTSSGQFMAYRFGLGGQFLQEISSDDPNMTAKIWQDAVELRQMTESITVSSGVLILALVKNFPNYEALLARLQLDFNDLIHGVRWHDQVNATKDAIQRPRKTGGIARDWSFGFIPLLERFAINVSSQIGRGLLVANIPKYQQTVDKMIETFAGGGRQNVVLVGEEGVGKTTCVYSFAEKLLYSDSTVPPNLKFRQVMMLDSASLIAAAPGRGELENLVMQILGEAYNAKNIILCLDNAQVFFEEGTGSVDLTNVLLPILEAGNLRVILTMNEQRLLQISRKNPALTNALNKIQVAPTNEEETLLVLQKKVLILESKMAVLYMYQAIKEAYKLGSRYIYDMQMPGQAIKMLEMAASYNDNKLVTVESVHQAIESTMNVKISSVNQEEERDKLLNLEDLIHRRMINQSRAVQVVANALRRARAGVRSQTRPIGTFLFLGPTGVGKTELSKALADVYFSGEENIVRVDLNEYVTVNDVARLIEDGAENPNSLTAQVMIRPFSVVLLDEIEKAHPAVLTTLLQLLDEGILRDKNNREVSFRDAIVVATSNAGSDTIRQYIEQGHQLEAFEQQITNQLIDSGQFKPEFLNRFDEIVLFRPLDKSELLQVLNLILNGINKTLASQKIAVEVAEDAKVFLVHAGYDPRLGARPMRRVVQATVENIVARKMIEVGAINLSGQTIHISLAEVQTIVGSGQSSSFINDPNLTQQPSDDSILPPNTDFSVNSPAPAENPPADF